jgi:hypothetical protein
VKIRVVDVIGDRATDMQQGDIICEQIIDAFSKGKKVVIDFENMITILSTFMNNAIGSLYKDYTSEFLNSNLKIINLSDDDLFILKRVIKRAKEFYANEQIITASLNENMSD